MTTVLILLLFGRYFLSDVSIGRRVYSYIWADVNLDFTYKTLYYSNNFFGFAFHIAVMFIKTRLTAPLNGKMEAVKVEDKLLELLSRRKYKSELQIRGGIEDNSKIFILISK